MALALKAVSQSVCSGLHYAEASAWWQQLKQRVSRCVRGPGGCSVPTSVSGHWTLPEGRAGDSLWSSESYHRRSGVFFCALLCSCWTTRTDSRSKRSLQSSSKRTPADFGNTVSVGPFWWCWLCCYFRTGRPPDALPGCQNLRPASRCNSSRYADSTNNKCFLYSLWLI